MNRIVHIIVSAFIITSCNFLEPLEQGTIGSDNIKDSPSYVRGFVETGYKLLPTTYVSNEYAYLDAAADNLVMTSRSSAMSNIWAGTLSPMTDPFEVTWDRAYRAINYANMFLQDDFGKSMRFVVKDATNKALAARLQGEAFAIRAWYQYMLLRMFSGKSDNGELLGFPIRTEPTNFRAIQPLELRRDSFDDCVARILADCDSALYYLPKAYRDSEMTDPNVDGSIGFHRFDKISMLAIKALTCLQWASPAFNEMGDDSRWEKAATYSYAAMQLKLEVDTPLGFDPLKAFDWGDANSPEIIFSSVAVKSSVEETAFYPAGFCDGEAIAGPSQELVDAFPMANGYPITHPASGYNPSKPFEGRDPRFYANIYYHLSSIGGAYELDTSVGGREEPGLKGNSLTGYYIRKFTNPEYNKNNTPVILGNKSLMHIRWTHICLAFAESANRALGSANDSSFGISAKEALSYVRHRALPGGIDGMCVLSDPYLDECALNTDKFDQLVRNERRIETCFEGLRFFDLQRWSAGDSGDSNCLNVDLNKMTVTGTPGAWEYKTAIVAEHRYASRWLPIPYNEVGTAFNIKQNVGWDAWK